MVSDTDNKAHVTAWYGNKPVKVTLEFPEKSNVRAEQEFIERLKAIYLEHGLPKGKGEPSHE